MSNILIGKGQRAAIIGSTGSGKTQMLMAQMRGYPYAPIYIMDTKGDESLLNFVESQGDNAKTISSIDALVKESKRKTGPDYIHIAPTKQEVSEPQLLDDYLSAIYDLNKPCLIAVDEIYQVNVGINGGPGLNGLLTRGRSKGMTVISCSQRPAWMSKFVITESQLFIIYRLNNPEDYEKIRKMGIPFPKNKELDKYYFYVYKSGEREGFFYEPLELKNNPGYTAEESSGKRWI